jgi:hypothetical protein
MQKTKNLDNTIASIFNQNSTQKESPNLALKGNNSQNIAVKKNQFKKQKKPFKSYKLVNFFFDKKILKTKTLLF